MTIQAFQVQYITDMVGQKTHVILPVEVYEWFKSLLDDSQFKIAETYRAQERVAAEDWDAPEMEAYDAL
ncbi:MAG TPA: hypothetical protein PKZ84_13680 [Anaerolineae bacterium]|nr:hypothetical protein [Anaerolineae bacterium]HQI85831.1 hypothetical protein [Anaerolineae bacterium]